MAVDVVSKLLFESPFSWLISACRVPFFVPVVQFYLVSNQSFFSVLRTSALPVSVRSHRSTVTSLSPICFLVRSRMEKMVKAAALSCWFSFGAGLHSPRSANSRIPSGVLGSSPSSLWLCFAGLFL